MHAIRIEYAGTIWQIMTYHEGTKLNSAIINYFAKNISHFSFLLELKRKDK
jgi:hypothetical protein